MITRPGCLGSFCTGLVIVLYYTQNPNVVGSGYIQFPPQRPFEKPVQVQPPTVAVR